MKMLSFDTCLDKTYVTLSDGNSFKNEIILSNNENYHSAYLISTIVKLLKEANLTPSDLEYISTDIGPGSFTGIRACVTVARMLAQQLDIKVGDDFYLVFKTKEDEEKEESPATNENNSEENQENAEILR